MGVIKKMLEKSKAILPSSQPFVDARIVELEAAMAAARTRIAELEAELEKGRAEAEAFKDSLEHLLTSRKDIAQDLDWFKRQIFGCRSERLMPVERVPTIQPDLFEMASPPAKIHQAVTTDRQVAAKAEIAPIAPVAPATACTPTPDSRKLRPAPAPRNHRHSKRKVTDRDCLSYIEGLEVVEVVIALPESQLIHPETGKRLVPVDFIPCDQLARRPGSSYIRRTKLTVYEEEPTAVSAESVPAVTDTPSSPVVEVTPDEQPSAVAADNDPPEIATAALPAEAPSALTVPVAAAGAQTAPAAMAVGGKKTVRLVQTAPAGGAAGICGCRVIAPMPPALVPHSKFAPSMQAYSVIEKSGFYMPHYRLQEKLALDGVFATRQLLSSNAMRVGEAIMPVCERMLDLGIAHGYFHTDSTGMKIQARYQCQNGHVFIFLVAHPDRPPYHIYHFVPTLEHAPVAEYLRNFTGTLTSDMWAGFWALQVEGGKILVAGCWSHLRRKFLPGYEQGCALSRTAVGKMQQIWQLEQQAAAMTAAERLAFRQVHAKPIVTEIFDLLKKAPGVSDRPKDKTRIAINYGLNHEAAFLRFLEDGNVRIDNNPAERALRKVVIGRNNYQFAGSERAAIAAMTSLSIIQTCRAIGVDAFAYLTALLSCSEEQLLADVEAWLPDQWLRRNPQHAATIPQRTQTHNWAALTQVVEGAAATA